jgi:hypothetical protein
VLHALACTPSHVSHHATHDVRKASQPESSAAHVRSAVGPHTAGMASTILLAGTGCFRVVDNGAVSVELLRVLPAWPGSCTPWVGIVDGEGLGLLTDKPCVLAGAAAYGFLRGRGGGVTEALLLELPMERALTAALLWLGQMHSGPAQPRVGLRHSAAQPSNGAYVEVGTLRR